MGKAERPVENHLRTRVHRAGGKCFKFNSGVSGVPDRIVILAGLVVFVETKSPVGVLSPLQVQQHQMMRAAGADIRVISTREAVDVFVEELLARIASTTTPTEGAPLA